MKSLYHPTPAQRSAFQILERLYRTAVDLRYEYREPLPKDHPKVEWALAELDRIVGFAELDEQPPTPPGEQFRRWTYFREADQPPLTQEDRYAGSDLADRLLIKAAYVQYGADPAQVVLDALHAGFRVGVQEWGRKEGLIK